MKKSSFKKLSAALLLLAVMIINACNKDEGIQFGTSVNASSGLEALSGWDKDFFSNNNWTMGLIFKTAKNGRITHIGARLAKGTYKVALWDSSAQSILTSANITVTDSTQYAFADISDISITAGKSYVVSVNNTDLITTDFKDYFVFDSQGPSYNFPRTVGDITFTGYLEKNTTEGTSMFPAVYNEDYFIGPPAFKFEPQL